MSFILKYFKQYKWALLLALLLATINQVFSLFDPQVFRMILDNYVSKYQEFTQHDFVMGVGGLLLLSVGVAMVSRIAKNLQDYVVNTMTQKIGMGIYQRTIRHIFSLPYSVFEDQQSGQLLQKLQKARDSVQIFITSLINNVFVAIVWVLFVFIYAIHISWIIAAFFGLILPLMWVVVFFLSKKLKKAQTSIVVETAALAGSTTETIRNVSLIKSLGLEQQEMGRLEDVNKHILGLEIKKIKTVRLIDFSQWTMINIVRVSLLATLLWLVYQGVVSLWEFFSLWIYSFFIFSPLYMLGELMKNYQEAKASDDVIRDILSMQPQVEESHPDNNPAKLEELRFSDVSFGYSVDDKTLQHVSFEAETWKTIAFVWPSGAGKSTIVKLLLGLYAPTKGEIYVNKTPLQHIDSSWYKAHIGYVAQDTQLFSGTISDNLSFVKPGASLEEQERVLHAAQLREFIQSQPLWLQTKIGEGWLKLSWWQKQRLAIARALLRQPNILIFDEATSSLDSMVEQEITDTIKEISADQSNMISIMIAHRLSTIMHADTIYVIEKGRVVEQWKHEDLVAQKWLYYALWRQQSGM
jgi:ATP-binding cassette, subfamily B, bacterial